VEGKSDTRQTAEWCQSRCWTEGTEPVQGVQIELWVMWQDILEATWRDLEATRHELKTWMVAVDTQTRHSGGGNAATSTDSVKTLKLDGSMSWVVFHHQLEAKAKTEQVDTMWEYHASAHCIAGISC
jgi:hypothetical protein